MAKARAKAGSSAAVTPSTDPSVPRDRRAARARLKDARAAIAANDLERADEIAREVRAWGLTYGFFDDTPEKVASAAFEARRRDAVRNAELMVRSYYRNNERPASTEPAATPRGTLPAEPLPPN